MRSSEIVQTTKKTTNVGTDIIIAIKEPLATISVMVVIFLLEVQSMV